MLTIADTMPSHAGFTGPFLAVDEHGGLDRPMTLLFADGCCEGRKKDGVSGKIGSATPPYFGRTKGFGKSWVAGRNAKDESVPQLRGPLLWAVLESKSATWER